MNLEKYLTFPMFSYDNVNKVINQRYNTWDFSTYMLPIEGKGFFDFYYTQLIANELYQKIENIFFLTFNITYRKMMVRNHVMAHDATHEKVSIPLRDMKKIQIEHKSLYNWLVIRRNDNTRLSFNKNIIIYLVNELHS